VLKLSGGFQGKCRGYVASAKLLRGSGEEPPAGSRGRDPGQGSGNEVPLKLNAI